MPHICMLDCAKVLPAIGFHVTADLDSKISNLFDVGDFSGTSSLDNRALVGFE